MITKYNHVAIGNVEKPLIPNLFFKELIETLNDGEVDFYELIIQEYTLESTQKRLAESKYQNIINGKKVSNSN